MCERLQAANTIEGTVHVGAYGSVIHEMTEMQTLCWGQWELNNQPVWAMQWMFIAAQESVAAPCAQLGQQYLRRSTSLFRPGADMFVGDEDNGSMSAWHLLNVLGLYSLAMGTDQYVLGAPLYAAVQVQLDGAAQPLLIRAVNQSPQNVYVRAVTWNGQPIAGVTISYFELMQGGTLEFQMTNESTAAAAATNAAADASQKTADIDEAKANALCLADQQEHQYRHEQNIRHTEQSHEQAPHRYGQPHHRQQLQQPYEQQHSLQQQQQHFLQQQQPRVQCGAHCECTCGGRMEPIIYLAGCPACTVALCATKYPQQCAIKGVNVTTTCGI